MQWDTDKPPEHILFPINHPAVLQGSCLLQLWEETILRLSKFGYQ